MLNLIRQFLRPTLREQLEAGVREALRRYADRQTAPNLRVYISEDLVPEGMDPQLWARDEGEHLRRFALQWSEDNSISRSGLRLETIVLDTKREFAFVKAMGVTREETAERRPASAPPRPAGPITGGAEGASAILEFVEPAGRGEPLRVIGDLTIGRKSQAGVQGLEDRYMSARHARFHVEGGKLWVTDLDSKNRTFLNEEPLPPHQATPADVGDVVRMGTTTLRVTRVES